MLFSSVSFLFVFFPIVFLLHLIVPKNLKNYILLIASIIFYAWGEPRYLIIMLLNIVINYWGAIGVHHYQDNKKISKLILILSIIGNLSFLFYFKYFNFIIENINYVFHSKIDIVKVIMPIGISFYTFQAMSYLVDVYRKEVEIQTDFCKLALYITLFPQLIAGPIVKYKDIAKQIDNRDIQLDKISYGMKRFVIGLSKKMLIANTLGAVADKVFSLPVHNFDCLTAWIGALAYSFQLFYDFSGYSDMAIGLGSIFGFKFLENFNYPYISKSITEFWRRWHISLSTWFKEYLYIPLGGNRVSKKQNLLNLWIVFLATGIWHGAEWTFVVWGMWHGLFIIIERLTNFAKKEGGKGLSLFKHIYTILAFVIGWVIFRAPTVHYAWRYIRRMFGLYSKEEYLFYFSYFINYVEIFVFACAIICAIPLFKNILNTKSNVSKILINIWFICLLVMSISSVAASTYNPFIYFRF